MGRRNSKQMTWIAINLFKWKLDFFKRDERNEMPHKQTSLDILWQCITMGGLGSVASIGALLRSPEELTRRKFWAAVINSGLFSAAIGMVTLWKIGSDHLLLAMTLSILSGLGGYSILDIVLGTVKTIIVSQAKKYDKEKEDDDA